MLDRELQGRLRPLHLVAHGWFYGFPSCCIQYFHSNLTRTRLDMRVWKKHTAGQEGTIFDSSGYIMCPACREQDHQTVLATIDRRRKMPIPFRRILRLYKDWQTQPLATRLRVFKLENKWYSRGLSKLYPGFTPSQIASAVKTTSWLDTGMNIETKEEYNAIVTTLIKLADSYYTHDISLVPDSEYDQLFRQVQAYERDYPEHTRYDSPTHRVGGGLSSSFAQHVHAAPMLSLANALNPLALQEWLGETFEGNEELLIGAEWKLDGLALAVTYVFGRLTCAATRGDGVIGEDVTANARTITDIPLYIPKLKDVPLYELRGEVVMPRSVFNQLNDMLRNSNLDLFVNPRNAAAGTMRQKDASVVAKRQLRFFAYGQSRVDEQCMSEFFQDMDKWKINNLGIQFHVTRDEIYDWDRFDQQLSKYNELRAKLDFDTDGLVFKVDDVPTVLMMGSTHRTPNWAIAYKFPPEQASTVLIDVVFQVGRTGVITPVANVTPIFVGGVTVSNLQLFNEDYINLHDLHYGDSVIIQRAGDVIPQLVSAVRLPSSGEKVTMPLHCPCCAMPVEKDGAATYCIAGFDCFDQLLGYLEYFVSKECMDIKGLAGATLTALIEAGLVETPVDLYRLEFDKLVLVPSIGAKQARKLLDAVDKSRVVELQRFIVSLGIENVGKTTAYNLASAFSTIDRFVSAENLESLTEIPDVGEETARAIRTWVNNPSNIDYLDKLLEEITITEAAHCTDELVGHSYVLSGSFTIPRDTYVKRLMNKGATVSSSVSKSTTALFIGENAGSKLNKARTLGVSILGEDDLIALLNGGK